MLDLHCHTTFSDGTLTPTELVNAARSAGITALAITDHDTLGGWDEARLAAGDDLEIVPGVELSTIAGGRSLHMLGFYPRRDQIEGPLRERMDGRKRRAGKMVEKLAALGYPVVLPDVGPDRMPGRPHVAAAMMAAGYVATKKEAFDRFLAEGQPGFEPYEPFDVLEGIRLLRECGGVPVWAHAFLWRGGDIEEALPRMVEAGLCGLEVFHPNHSPSDRRKLLDWCDRYDLLVTGGSDYHGPQMATRGLNSQRVSLEYLEEVKAAAR
jgi:3',5'-nucleoside bisphosphate phosphatase